MRRFVFIIFIFAFPGFSQDIRLQGKFIEDSIKIGEPLRFSLSVLYPKNQAILFPDSSFNFSPFEFIRKEYIPTKTRDGMSTDSVIYILRTFETNLIQKLSLPVYQLLEAGDSTIIYSEADFIFVKNYIDADGKENFILLENTKMQKVKKQFNYPHLLLFAALILFISLILFFFFGKGITKRYKLYVLRKSHNSFVKNFERLEKEFSVKRELLFLEEAMGLWKIYLSRLENKPVNTYTTTEITGLYGKEDLKESLNTLDKAVYGGIVSDQQEKALALLKKFSTKRYLKKKKAIRNV